MAELARINYGFWLLSSILQTLGDNLPGSIHLGVRGAFPGCPSFEGSYKPPFFIVVIEKVEDWREH